MKITWSEYNTIRRIKNYLHKYHNSIPKYPDNKKDFYNIITGEIICGKCDKKMRPFKALFHFHFN